MRMEDLLSESLMPITMAIASFASHVALDDKELCPDDDSFLTVSGLESELFNDPSSESARPRKGSTESPVCVSSFCDQSVTDDDHKVCDLFDFDVIEDLDILEISDPDKLNEAICELCDPILQMELERGESIIVGCECFVV
jgi:hypothetical protein